MTAPGCDSCGGSLRGDPGAGFLSCDGCGEWYWAVLTPDGVLELDPDESGEARIGAARGW